MPNFVTDFSGKTVIVTGAGAGIGKATAEAFARSGANVVINDLNPDRTDTVTDEIIANGGHAVGIQGDISNRFQVAAVIERARDAFGRIDYLINAAGIFKAEPIDRIDEWDWRRQIEVNLTGTFFCTQLISRVMADEGGGVIINLASTAGHPYTLPEGIGYVSSKAGIVAFTSQSARELAPKNIRVNAVCPNYISEGDMPHFDTPANALQRMGTPEEVADVILFLCSDSARFITGQSITVDGGEGSR